MRAKVSLTTENLITNMNVIRCIVSDNIPVKNFQYYSEMMKTCDDLIQMLEDKMKQEQSKKGLKKLLMRWRENNDD